MSNNVGHRGTLDRVPPMDTYEKPTIRTYGSVESVTEDSHKYGKY